jgi:hypothetical protein
MTPFRLIVISLLLFSFKHSNGQNSKEHLDSIVNSFVNSLNAKGIDTVCLYQDYCVVGFIYVEKDEDKCNFEGLFMPTYIFGKTKDNPL